MNNHFSLNSIIFIQVILQLSIHAKCVFNYQTQSANLSNGHQQETFLTNNVARCYLLHLLCADWLVGVRFQVRYVRRIVGCRGGASVFAAHQLTGSIIGRMVQAVIVQHCDHFLFDQLLCQLEF